MRIFKISFVNQGKVYQIYARQVRPAELYGFIEIEDLVFGEPGGLVIDPSEERLKDEFAGVRRTLVPIHATIRIDEVEKQGTSKIMDLDPNAKITPFPTPFTPPTRD